MWICKELLSKQTVGSHRSFYCGTNVCYLSMDPHANTIWHLLLCFLPVYTFVGCVCWRGSTLGTERVPGEEAVECPAGLCLLQHRLEFPAVLCSVSSTAWHWTVTNYSFPQEKHLQPEWRACLLFLNKHPWFCGSNALCSRSCCHYTSSRRLLSSFWWFSPHFFHFL